jgi:RNA polymerase sigma factor for flagellar operon FliA
MQSAYSKESINSVQDRERLIIEHLPQVRWIAANVHEKLPAGILQEDLVSAGIIGLIAAIDNFDPSRNTSLRTYAEYRIRGAILDSVRGLNGIPSHHRKRAKEVQAAIETAEQRLGRSPSEEEIAGQLGIDLDEYHETLLDVRAISLGALDAVPSENSAGGLLRYLADRDDLTPGWIVEREALEKLLAQGIASMPKPERTVISLYFKEELTLAEIGRVMGLHTSRVSQLKSQAILRLRSRLAARWPTTRGMVTA